MAKSDISRKIKPVSELPMTLTALIYGRSGTGKTTFAATWPKPLLLVDIREKGTDSIARVEDVDVISIENWEELEDLYWFLKKSTHQYQTVVLDQVTQMQDLAKRRALKDDGKPEDSGIFSQRIWGNIAGMMNTWLLHYRDLDDLGINVCFIAQDRTTESSDEGGSEGQIDPTVGARLMPSVAGFLNAAVKLIGNTFIRENYVKEVDDKGKSKRTRIVEYAMRLGPHSVYLTKLRTGKNIEIPATIVNPTYDAIVSIMRSSPPAHKPVRRK